MGPPASWLVLVALFSGLVLWACSLGLAQDDCQTRTQYINPLPPGLENIFSGFNHVFVVEMNDEGLYGYGQLAGLLRARYCDPKIRGINKVEGITFKVREILERAKSNVSTGMRHL